MSESQPKLPNRQTLFSDAFKAFIAKGWSPYPNDLPPRLPAADAAAARRRRVSAQFPGQRLVIPAGGLKIRSNDTDYRFRPHSAFAHLTGLGADREPDAVLVLEPTDSGHDAALYFKPRAPRDSAEFYADARYGEMWVGRRPSLEEMAAWCGIRCVPVAELDEHLAKNAEETTIRVVRNADPALAERLDRLRGEIEVSGEGEEEQVQAKDAEFAEALSELRLVKDGSRSSRCVRRARRPRRRSP
ncbi:MAG: aminopeptidase P N-terminal domain-containing protein, partial [Microlunatus sp.]|nr:aminopeptidase P N-terminal domain-containing protein [Microlunatus sp.]